MTFDIKRKAWDPNKKLRRVLFIRLQALGDTVITLPYIQGFREEYPDVQIDFLTRKEVDGIPRSLRLFRKVYSIGGGRNAKLQAIYALIKGLMLRGEGYDMVIDLQNNKISKVVRKIIAADSWVEFDRSSKLLASQRTHNTMAAIGLRRISPSYEIDLKDNKIGRDLLSTNGWDENGKRSLVVLNPAGFFKTRNWPLDFYVSFAKKWLTEYNANTLFLILGIGSILPKARYLKEKLGDSMINLVSKTSVEEAFSIIQNIEFMLTEDSGLMHMASSSGKPTLALFGSTRSDWSAPFGKYSLCLDSSDLECGGCMQDTCQWGDIRCLTRYTPEFVFEEAMKLMKNTNSVRLS